MNIKAYEQIFRTEDYNLHIHCGVGSTGDCYISFGHTETYEDEIQPEALLELTLDQIPIVAGLLLGMKAWAEEHIVMSPEIVVEDVEGTLE